MIVKPVMIFGFSKYESALITDWQQHIYLVYNTV